MYLAFCQAPIQGCSPSMNGTRSLVPFSRPSAPFVPSLSSHPVNSMPLTLACSPLAPLLCYVSRCHLSLDFGSLCLQPPLSLPLCWQWLDSEGGLPKTHQIRPPPPQKPVNGLPVAFKVKSKCCSRTRRPELADPS